ncbi:MAG: hypothetical protein ACI9SQ_000906 [Rubritalea sp.]|jgi:hypothetical protein
MTTLLGIIILTLTSGLRSGEGKNIDCEGVNFCGVFMRTLLRTLLRRLEPQRSGSAAFIGGCIISL